MRSSVSEEKCYEELLVTSSVMRTSVSVRGSVCEEQC